MQGGILGACGEVSDDCSSNVLLPRPADSTCPASSSRGCFCFVSRAGEAPCRTVYSNIVLVQITAKCT